MRLGRRAVLAGAPLLLAAGALRVAALDYGLTETLLALGSVPVGLPDPADYRRWVVDPPLPPGPVDLGQRTQPNLELLASLRPDLVLTIPDHDPILPQLRQISPVLRLPIYTRERDPWERSVLAARAIGERLGREAEAEALVSGSERRFAEARTALDGRRAGPVLLGSFLDPRHLLLYGAGSILQAALDRLGVRNGWTGATGIWGSATVGLEALAAFGDATLFTFDPQPPDGRRVLDASPLWRALPFVRAGRVVELPPVLMFGTLPAANRFLSVLLPHLLDAGAGG